MEQSDDAGGTMSEQFPTDPTGLPEATSPAIVEVRDGAGQKLRIIPVAKRLGDTTVRMLAYAPPAYRSRSAGRAWSRQPGRSRVR
jgi:hypothetical protein